MYPTIIFSLIALVNGVAAAEPSYYNTGVEVTVTFQTPDGQNMDALVFIVDRAHLSTAWVILTTDLSQLECGRHNKGMIFYFHRAPLSPLIHPRVPVNLSPGIT